MERPYVVDGFCSSEFDFSGYRTCHLRPDPPPEAVAVIVRGGLHKAAEVVERYPESVAAAGRLAGPRSAVVTVLESACCVRPRALGNSLLFASSRPVRLELTFAEVFVRYEEAGPPGPDGSAVYRREVDVRRFRRGVRLKPLHPALIEYLANHELDYHYWIDPPNRLVVHLDGDDAHAYVTFGDGGVKVDVKFLRPTILAYSASYVEKVARRLGLTT